MSVSECEYGKEGAIREEEGGGIVKPFGVHL